jgi:hypothetical protein
MRWGPAEMLSSSLLPVRHTLMVRFTGETIGWGPSAEAAEGRRAGALWLLTSFAVTAALFAAVLVAFVPFWETNDDVAMSMVAHGYGSANAPSASLLFQNVLIGYLLQVLPRIDGVLAYSWLMLVFIFSSCWALLYYVGRSGGAFWLAIAALALVVTQIVPEPQFTKTAGVAAAAGLLVWISHVETRSWSALVVGSLLFMIGFLVRTEEALFVALVAIPLMPWHRLRIGWPEIATAAGLLCFAAFAEAIDYLHYQGPEWAAFKAMQPLRAALTDYNYSQYLFKQPERMQALGFSKNDIRLIESWFFFDPAMADPERLRQLLAGWFDWTRMFKNVFLIGESFRVLLSSTFTPLIIAAAVLSLFSRRCSAIAGSWLVFLLVIVIFTMAGRPAIVRTYFAIPVLLMFASLGWGLRDGISKPMYRMIPWLVMIAALGMTLSARLAQNRDLIERSRIVRADMAALKRGEQYVVWGASLPFEVGQPVLARDIPETDFKQYGLGWETLAPYSMAQFSGTPWRDLVDRIARDKDIPFIASEADIRLMAVYCREHHHKELTYRKTQLETFNVLHVTCSAR